ncbi:MAG: histone deacetylase [Myxococcales bacterium]|nr:histone deacetylase [Myxococcales bacterium]
MLPVFGDRSMMEHEPGEIEDPSRLAAVLDALRKRPGVQLRTPTQATRGDLCRVHDEAYVDRLLATAGTSVVLDADTRTSPGSIDAARLAAGAARDAVFCVLEGEARAAFAAVRPPGHHACFDRAMGFCLFNNVVVAAEAARMDHDVERVLFVDWDVHHGNGTQDLVAGRGDSLFFSVHQGGGGFYPGTGLTSEGNALNVPLQPGAGDAEMLAAVREVLRPAADDFAPELVIVSAGFDAHVDDPLGSLCATPQGYAALCREVAAIARDHARSRMVLVLEGGYDLAALGASSVACAEVLGG